LKLSSEVAAAPDLGYTKRTDFSVFDLVTFNNNKSNGMVLSIERDTVKVLDDMGKSQLVKINDIGKKRFLKA
jgi:hypothetical protein